MKNANPFMSKRRANSEMTLQITSMADIFTIILVFLLKSYSTSSVALVPSAGLKLPEAKGAEEQVQALKIEVSETAIQVDDNPVVSLANYRFGTGDLQANSVSKSLAAALELQRKRQVLIASSNSDVKVDSKILIVADQRTPYSTLKAVLASAAVHGFTDYKLVVARKE